MYLRMGWSVSRNVVNSFLRKHGFVEKTCVLFWDPKITYSGPTFVAIRSGKHNSSTLCTHGRDFDHLLELNELDEVVKQENTVKPIGMYFCDGGPDKNSGFPKILDVAIQHFKK